MDMKDITGKSEADLGKLLAEKREALRQFRFGEAGSRSRDVKEGRTLKREIAMIMTALHARVAERGETA